jgi:hypothetical protein
MVDTIVQLLGFRTSGFIAPSHSIESNVQNAASGGNHGKQARLLGHPITTLC